MNTHHIHLGKENADSDPNGKKNGKNGHPPRAIALGYDPEKDQAPRVLASGQGALADRIIAIAKENDILIQEDPILAAALAQVEIDSEIPPELYAVVAEVLAYVYRIQERESGSRRGR